jgi:hypothetical protein
VLCQRLEARGGDGGLTLVRDDRSRVCPRATAKAVVSRFASAPGVPCQIAWGHCGPMAYGHTTRPLSCLAVVACHSRRWYLALPHAPRPATLHRRLLGAWRCFQGTPPEVVHENRLTAVIAPQGPLGRGKAPGLAFLRPFHLPPMACHVRHPQEKGTVATGARHDMRPHCWPLRSCTSLDDRHAQAPPWRDRGATRRGQSTTGWRPIARFRPAARRPRPECLPDGRDSAVAKGPRDGAIPFAGHTYAAPPWARAQPRTVQADHHHGTLYGKDSALATQTRCWGRQPRLARPAHRQAAHHPHHRHWLSPAVAAVGAVGAVAKDALAHLAPTPPPLQTSVTKLRALPEDSGTPSLFAARQRARHPRAGGAHYIENLLEQAMPPPERIHR